MPFPGIPAGSALEAKIDRCVNRVMATGRDKSRAIAICRASIAGTTQKSEQDAIKEANYRDAGPASTQICNTCRFGDNAQKQCSLFRFTYKNNWTCDRWRPNIEATRNRLRQLQMSQKQVETETIQLEIEATPLVAQRLKRLLAMMSYNSSIGHSANFGMFVDGDGADYLKVNNLDLTEFADELKNFQARYNTIEMAGEDSYYDMRLESRSKDTTVNAEKRKELIEQAKERIALKREIPQRVRRDLGRGDFVFPETRSFPIVKPEDVRAAVSSWGRASTVRARGFTFEDFKRRLTAMAKRKGAAFVAALPADWKQGQSEKATFTVFKDANGKWRWVMRSSSAYQDKDGEIVSTKALTRAVEIHDQTADRGPLRWWHVKDPAPINLGTADFGMMHGKILVESGVFPNEAVGAAIAEKAHLLEGSIGFHHPTNEPINGVFENISIFERSLLPRGRASNLFTALNVYKEYQMSDEKIKALKNLLGEDVANQLLAQATSVEKAADGLGITFKELGEAELSQLSADALLEYALAKKEYEEAQAKAQPQQPAQAKEDQGQIIAYLDRIMAKLETHETAIKEMQATKEAQPPQQPQQQPPPSPWEKLDERLKALESDQPPALQRGYRASQDGAPVEDPAKAELTEREKAMKEAMEKNPEIAPFANVGASFGAGSNPAAFGGHPYWGAPWQQPPNATPPPAK